MNTNPAKPTKLLLHARDAAEALSISTRTLWTLTQPRGPIPAVRLGCRVLYDPTALGRWIAQQQTAKLPIAEKGPDRGS
jgi:hypothetical protein